MGFQKNGDHSMVGSKIGVPHLWKPYFKKGYTRFGVEAGHSSP